jgi:hypothetical protein
MSNRTDITVLRDHKPDTIGGVGSAVSEHRSMSCAVLVQFKRLRLSSLRILGYNRPPGLIWDGNFHSERFQSQVGIKQIKPSRQGRQETHTTCEFIVRVI